MSQANIVHELCGESDGFWLCTRPLGHKGHHIATGMVGQEWARWPSQAASSWSSEPPPYETHAFYWLHIPGDEVAMVMVLSGSTWCAGSDDVIQVEQLQAMGARWLGPIAPPAPPETKP